MTRPHYKHIAHASAQFLTERLPNNWQDMSDSVLDQFMADHAWEPFEYWPIEDVWELIDTLAMEFYNIEEGK
jgi:hypothetical protein